MCHCFGLIGLGRAPWRSLRPRPFAATMRRIPASWAGEAWVGRSSMKRNSAWRRRFLQDLPSLPPTSDMKADPFRGAGGGRSKVWREREGGHVVADFVPDRLQRGAMR